MESNNYWKGLEELHNEESFVVAKSKEFQQEIPVEEIISETLAKKSAGRRDFLKLMGFSVTAATIAASCKIPVKKAIPYAIKPEEIIPGVANYYASSYIDGTDYCPVLVKVRDGRPIKVEGNTSSTITKGGTTARVQASVLSLYDKHRQHNPKKLGKDLEWSTLDSEIKEQLEKVKASNGQIRILSSTILSPSTRAIVNDFIAAYPNTKHVVYEPVSYSAIADANEVNFGKRVVPGYSFDQAKVIVGFSCDFLGTWLSPIEYAKGYTSNRKLSKTKKEMNKHFHFESRMSITGAAADIRTAVTPSNEKLAIISLYNKIATATGNSTITGSELNKNIESNIDKAAEALLKNTGKSLVVSGINDTNVQCIINGINKMLSNYGTTIDLDNYSLLGQSNDKQVAELSSEMSSGTISALIIYNSNPIYSLPNSKDFEAALKKVPLSISINDRMDETASQVVYTCPDHHYLESWGDAEPRLGFYSMSQPTISPLFLTRQAQDSLLTWIGSTVNYETYLQNFWKNNILLKSSNTDFVSFWENSVRNGLFESTKGVANVYEFKDNSAQAANSINSKKTTGIELVLYEKVGVGNGKNANNPWLQELPDPITKTTWDNYISLPVKYAVENNIHDGDIVEIKGSNGASIKLPVIKQPGQANNSAAIAIGYGRSKSGPAANNLGANAYPFLTFDGTNYNSSSTITITATGANEPFARTQTHQTIEGRNVIKETSLDEWLKDPMAGNEEREEYDRLDKTTLYPGHKYDTLRWHMSIDLNSCYGCGACVVACNAENNIPVVGRDEVKRVHEMHWMRIDRYYSFTESGSSSLANRITESKKSGGDNLDKLTLTDYENVNVTFQPMLCQHCENAPCENVCPVAATNHSSEGLNQMAYNRCIGTRYCANNCPYKVRRFNWFDYTTADSFPNNTAPETQRIGMIDNLTRMVLNPDVTVRSRGVMEKCSFCVQKIQEGKLQAKKDDRILKDGEIKTACQLACSGDAIMFGNVNDESSEVAKLKEDERTFYVLQDINTKPSIGYLTKVRNIEETKSKA